MASRSSPPDFGPVVPQTMYTSNSCPSSEEARKHLFYLRHTADYSDDHTSWGFTLYRAVFGPGTDERFARAVERLRDWVQFDVRQSRYDTVEGVSPPDPSLYHETDELARRFWIEVVEDYEGVGTGAVRAGFGVEPGSEDFSLVGRAFLSWVADRAKDPSTLNRDRYYNKTDTWDLYVRHDYCLVVDERALAALETLPETPLELRPRGYDEHSSIYETCGAPGAWVWLLDRKTMQDREDGKPPVLERWMEPGHPPFPPWCRISITDLFGLWFSIPDGLVAQGWGVNVLEGKSEVEFGRVRYWGPNVRHINEALMYSRRHPRPETPQQGN